MDQRAPSTPATADLLVDTCIEACHAAATALRRHAAQRTAAGVEDRLLGLMQDCAEVCLATAGYLRADSVFRLRMLDACADLCRECATATEAHATHADAAAACRACARSCQALREALAS